MSDGVLSYLTPEARARVRIDEMLGRAGWAVQSAKYLDGLPDWVEGGLEGTLKFAYQSTGSETRFTNTLDPEARSHEVFWFHRPEALAEFRREAREQPLAPTLRSRLVQLPTVGPDGLWSAQFAAIRNLERSLGQNRPRALIQMVTGSGKTFTAANVAYRLIKHDSVLKGDSDLDPEIDEHSAYDLLPAGPVPVDYVATQAGR